MKILVLLLAIVLSVSMNAQVYKQTSSEVHFFSEAPLENIEAFNKNSKAVLRINDSALVVVITNLAFRFEKPLMEEHFNENYMESETYPYSSFKGKVVSGMDFSEDGTYQVEVKGMFEVHGVKEEKSFKGMMTKSGNKISFSATFMMHVEDYKIKVPTMYVKNIAEDVKVDLKFELKKA
jgi:hypothetical protein